ncbi:MAG TPA: amidohydrolase family protein [Tepidisphaeraceae bacterium]|jgi:cytosine/adenosine deaminase-related metal-dependent hydrolase|nr:amidohydrolase family protein [Tepidisphaeraceae bacterium]
MADPPDAESITVFRSRFVATMHGPIIAGGAVAISQGRISGVGPWADVRRSASAARVEDLGESILLPGLVNAHTHLELSDVARPAEMNGFVPWLLTVMAARREPTEGAVSAGIEQSLRFGVTCVGDITRQPRAVRPMLRQSGLRAVSFGEVTAMAQRRGLLDEWMAGALDGASDDFLHVGISPHAPYSVEPFAYSRCLAEAIVRKMPIATHLAESLDETVFLEQHAGPFRQLWETLGRWDEAVPRFTGGPIRYARHLGLLAYPTLLAHVNYCDDAELAILAAGKASVACCPRTHAYFQHPPHRWRDMLAVGINVAVGTDSAASSGDLNLVDDLRLLHRLAPESPAEQLWELVTTRAAKALMQDREIGSLEAGKWADMVAFDAVGDDPLREILETDAMPTQVWIAGKGLGSVSKPNDRAAIGF